MQTIAIILAAGEGKRMQSDLPKVLHEVGGKPMIDRVIDATSGICQTKPIVVVGAGAAAVEAHVAARAMFATQSQRLGTGHAVLCAQPLALSADYIIVLAGDMPLIDAPTVERLSRACIEQQAAASLLYFETDHPTGYGRVLMEETKDTAGMVQKSYDVWGIVEEKDANEAQRRIGTVNASAYCFEAKALWHALENITNENAQGEYYLTDCIGILAKEARRVVAVQSDEETCLGVNDQEGLQRAERALKERKSPA